ncbi:MAG TPA: flagellar hook capping FlgD N-terminal domain-containing protein [Syntrophomonadaceae bacterium]|nr:flagellar hook capping FlgD N-terminal domain-containing protein [Syntrophomonadaceae bacterium]
MSTTSTSSDYWITPSTSSSSTSSSSSTKGKSNVTDFETFVKILSAELKNQDPTNPVSNTEYVSQMAQIYSLQELNSINNSNTTSQACSMIGKTVTYGTTDSSGNSASTTGVVDAVVINDNTAYLKVNGSNISLSNVIQVEDSSSSTATE